METIGRDIAPFLTFMGRAEEAMNFYVSLFDHSEVLSITRYGADVPGAEGMVMHATFSLRGRVFMCIDSPVQHEWGFTPAISLWVPCESDEEIERLYRALSDGGQVYMELGSYPFSAKFAWVGDRFGVTWQLSLDR